MFLNVAAAQSLYNTGARAFPGLCPTHTMANPAGPGAGSANAPGTASARDLEQYTTHMLPSPPQMPPIDAEEDGDEDDVLILLCTHLESFLSLPPPQPPYHPQGGLIGIYSLSCRIRICGQN